MNRGSSKQGSVSRRAASAAVALTIIVIGVAVGLFFNRTSAPRIQPPEASDIPTVTASPHGSSSAEPLEACGKATVVVADPAQLSVALASAHPGDTIQLRAGTYVGSFTANISGTAADPVFLCGTPHAVLSAGNAQSGYGFHLDHASYWHLVGFSVRQSQKGVVVDASSHVVIQRLTVSDVGDEGIHIRENSTDNLILGNIVRHTGIYKARFGEGIYIGSAHSNWCAYTKCGPDRSDRNTVRANVISGTSAESVDVKEGTSDGTIERNSFNGAAMTGADSWVDVKGNGWTITGNVGVSAPQDGYQTHVVADGWGDHNTFAGNESQVDAPGYAVHLTKILQNQVACDNSVSGAGEGLSNTHCTN